MKPLITSIKFIHTRPYKKLNPDQLFADALHVPTHTITSRYNCPHMQSQQLEDNIQSLLDGHIPIKTIRVRDFRPPWLTPQLLRLSRKKNSFFNKVYRSNLAKPTPNHIRQYKEFRNMVTQQINIQKCAIIQQQLTTVSTSFYKCTKKLLGLAINSFTPTQISINDKMITGEKNIVNCFNTHFSTIPT